MYYYKNMHLTDMTDGNVNNTQFNIQDFTLRFTESLIKRWKMSFQVSQMQAIFVTVFWQISQHKLVQIYLCPIF